MATNLRPFRDYDEHDVVNLFAFSGSYPQTKGNIVNKHLIHGGCFISFDIHLTQHYQKGKAALNNW